MILLTSHKKFFITDSRYAEEAEETMREFEIVTVRQSTYATLSDLARRCGLKRMGFEATDAVFDIAMRLKSLLRPTTLIPTQKIVEDLRMIKDPEEIGAIRASIRVTKKVFAQTLRLIRPGLSEKSLAHAIDSGFLSANATPAFETIVAAGTNASRPHSRPTSGRIRQDSFVMIDAGCRLRNYCSDFTRTVVIGAMQKRFAEIYTIVRQAQKNAIEAIRDGAKISDVDYAARGHIQSMGFGDHFTHSLGHGVGMQIHESPTLSNRSDACLKKGMVVTVEPAIYIKDFGGIRIEDMVLVTNKGCEILT